MALFTLDKEFNEIDEVQVMPDDYYDMLIVSEPKLEKNKAAKAGKSPEEGGGINLILNLRVVNDLDEFNGRKFWVYLRYPSKPDFKLKDARTGRTMYDEKMVKLGIWHAAFNDGEFPEGNQLNFEANMVAKVPVETNAEGNNEINPFGADPEATSGD